MNYLVIVFGILIGAMSAFGIINPGGLMRIVIQAWRMPWGMGFAVAVRLVLGLVCLLAAGQTRYPMFYQVVAYLALAGAVLIPVLGRERLDRIIEYWRGRADLAIRAWLTTGLVLSYFLVRGAL